MLTFTFGSYHGQPKQVILVLAGGAIRPRLRRNRFSQPGACPGYRAAWKRAATGKWSENGRYSTRAASRRRWR
jgi:hypothetical protein